MNFVTSVFIVLEKLFFSNHESRQQFYCQQVLQRLQTDQFDDSCDDNKENKLLNEKFSTNCIA